MSHLNYFLPFYKGTDSHEDHLTRAFIVLLKYSNSALQQFYSYVYQQLEREKLKPLHMVALTEVNFETQVGSLPEANSYVSILITNERVTIDKIIEPVDRVPIYDGVIEITDELVFFIETKPNKGNVWEEQLCPAKKDIPEDAELINKVAVLEWKEIINFLHRISENSSTPPSERLMIGDFFELINTSFDYLNPYNDFSKCHSSYLANKRIEQILREIAFQPDKVKYHYGWGYYLELEFLEIKKIALLLRTDEKGNWNELTIAADFGSTVSQARAFYQRVESYQHIEDLKEFEVRCNLHLAFRSQNLVHLQSPKGSIQKYFNYWKSDVWSNFGGIPKEKLIDEFLKEYEDEGILILDQEKLAEINNVIMSKVYQRINICPSIYVMCNISREEACRLDKQGKLTSYLRIRMKEVLTILNYPLDNLFN